MPSDLSGRTAVVTGAASGIGRATAARLAADGVAVVGLDVSTEPGDGRASFADRVEGGELIVGDVADPADVDRAATAAEEAGDEPISIAVNCAGIGSGGRIDRIDPDRLRRTLAVHVEGTFNVCRRVLPAMADAGRGCVVNTSSIAAAQGWPGMADYSPAKGAIESLTRQLAVDFSPAGVRVNAVAPGFVRTGMNADVWREDRERRSADRVDPETARDRTLLPYLGDPADVAGVIAFLASEDARFVTGQVVTVDGGWTVAAF